MSKLLRAGLRRYIKSIYFWISSVLAALVGIYAGYSTKQNQYLEPLIFLVLVFIQGLLIALMIGREFGDGIFRNKIVAGHSKGTIFISESILAFICSAWLFVLKTFGFTITNHELITKMPVSVLLLMLLGFFLITISISFLMVFVSTSISNRAFSVACTILLVVAMMFGCNVIEHKLCQEEKIPEMIYSESDHAYYPTGNMIDNPKYVGGVRRKTLKTLYNLIPISQSMQYNGILEQGQGYKADSENLELTKDDHSILKTTIVYAILNISLYFGAGYILFKKRNFK